VIRDHLVPSTLKEALDLKQQLGEKALFVAGGTDLFIRMREKMVFPQYLIDLTKIRELIIQEKIEADHLNIGACQTVYQISKSSLIERYVPSLVTASAQLGSPAIRNQATIGGNLVNASPAADLVPPLIAQGATVHTVSSNRRRSFPLEELFTDVNKTILFPDEILTHISVSILQPLEGAVYLKLGLREALSISVVTVAIWLKRKGRKVEGVRIALGSVAPRIFRASRAETFLSGKPLTTEMVYQTADIASQECQPISDIRASSEYRKSMVVELVKIGLETVWRTSVTHKG
jgi:CO/xanthine dehydrogenase FAD-binding subunit